jgi:hypothetical protein
LVDDESLMKLSDGPDSITDGHPELPTNTNLSIPKDTLRISIDEKQSICKEVKIREHFDRIPTFWAMGKSMV